MERRKRPKGIVSGAGMEGWMNLEVTNSRKSSENERKTDKLR